MKSPSVFFIYIRKMWQGIFMSYVYYSLLFHYHGTVPTVTQWFSATDLYYGGEALTAEQPQSFTCPYCGKMGYTDATLHEHVTAEHGEASTEVVSISRCIHTYNDIKLQGSDKLWDKAVCHRISVKSLNYKILSCKYYYVKYFSILK